MSNIKNGSLFAADCAINVLGTYERIQSSELIFYCINLHTLRIILGFIL